MIRIGLTGWGDHPSLYTSTTAYKLVDYSAHFPLVEVDSSFYAIPRETTIHKWIHETPRTFQFIVKAYKGMTGHLQKSDWPFETTEAMFEAYRQAFLPMQQSGKLAFLLFQFPPSFLCGTKEVNLLRYIRQQLPEFDIAIEFRHMSWFEGERAQATLQFLKHYHFIHTIVDEPQVGMGCVPKIVAQTAPKMFYRLHGQNDQGWVNTFGSSEAWRKVRYLYNYSEQELAELQKVVQQEQGEQYIIFNNNSGHHAAPNAKRLQQLLQIEYEDLAPMQLDLFKEDL